MCRALSSLMLLSTSLVSSASNIIFLSFDTLFFTPDQVLNNAWFAQSTSALSTSLAWADELRASGPWTVTNKTFLPRSNDPHDYYSLAVYWWPNCSSLTNTTELTEQQVWDDCPYIRRDGLFNPDIYEIQNLEQVFNMTDSVYLSAMAYAATKSSIYSSFVNDAMYTFFVNQTTRMNPNLNFAQVIRGPGSQPGGYSGVLDMETIAKTVAGVEVMRKSGAAEWLNETEQGVVAWAAKMVEWLTTSDLALQERAELNNHGSYYYNQLCSLYLLLNDTSAARTNLETFYNTTFLGQIAAKGDQPLESSRTRPYHYRAYNLAALIVDAKIGEYVGLSPDPWTRRSSAGATLQDALNFAIAQDPAAFNETDPVTRMELNPLVAAVASKFGDPDGKYLAFLNSTDPMFRGQPYFALAGGLGGRTSAANGTATATLGSGTVLRSSTSTDLNASPVSTTEGSVGVMSGSSCLTPISLSYVTVATLSVVTIAISGVCFGEVGSRI